MQSIDKLVQDAIALAPCGNANRMRIAAKLILTILLVSLVAVSARSSDDLMAALASAPLTTVYHDDGAADATVTAFATADLSRQDAPAAVRAILDLGPSCIPLLIAHLDDRRLTSARFDGGRFAHTPIQVPLGHICLDILLSATSGETVHLRDCADDGLGACVRSGYYFRPDVLQWRGGVAAMRRVKARWQRAYRAKVVRFEFPAWLKRG
jgi:hypothetical protein